MIKTTSLKGIILCFPNHSYIVTAFKSHCEFLTTRKQTITEEETTTNMKTSLQLVLTGASGYLGQHLLHNWIENCNRIIGDHYNKLQIVALYHKADGFSQAVEKHVADKQEQSSKLEVLVQSIDITDQTACQGLKQAIEKEHTTTTTVIIHTAALSSPRICTDEPEKAKALNIPTYFFDAMKDYPTIALSTDQVYDGKQQQPGNLYKETDTESIKPVNIYGQTKLDMEEYLQKNNNGNSGLLFILRSSIILGPHGPYGCGVHTTFFDFIKSRQGQATTFFMNEYRTVVSLQFVINVINDIIQYIVKNEQKKQQQDIPTVYNMGGPNRVNRYDMAKSVFDYLKYDYDDTILIKAEQSSPSVPLDISMDSTLLEKYGFGSNSHPKTLSELVEYVFTASSKSTMS